MKRISVILFVAAIIVLSSSPVYAVDTILGQTVGKTMDISTITGTGGAILLHTRQSASGGLFINTSNNVGIGTATPGSALEVNADIVAKGGSGAAAGNYLGLFKGIGSLPGYTSDSYPTLKTDFSYIYFATGGAYSAYLGNGSTPVFGLNGASGGVYLNSSGNSYLMGGNVGIGTTSPTSSLHIRKDQNAQTLAFVENRDYTNSSSRAGFKFLQQLSPTATYYGQIVMGQDGKIHIDHELAPDSIVITNNGNVGIGTTSPGQRLSVAGTIESTSGGIKFPDASIQTTAYLGGAQTINSGNVSAGGFASNTGGGNFSFPGNLGVSIAGPVLPLQVGGVINAGGNYYNIVSWNYNGTPTNGVKIKTNIPYTSGSQMPTIIIEGYDYGSQNPIGISLVWYIYAGNFVSYKASSYGNTAPAIKLANEGGYVTIWLDWRPYYGRFTVRAYEQGMTGNNQNWFNGSQWSVVDEVAGTANQVTVPYANTFPGTVNFAGGIWNSSGNVGIGTTSPGGRLDISGAYPQLILNNPSQGGGSLFVFKDNGTAAGAIGHMTTTTALQLSGINGSTPHLTITSGGSVGIGTTSPGTSLDVVGGDIRGDHYLTLQAYPGYGTGSGTLYYSGNANQLITNEGIRINSGSLTFSDSTTQTTAYLGGSQTISAGNVSAGSFGSNTGGGNYTFPGSLTVNGAVYYGLSNTRTETRTDAGLQGNAGAQSGFFQNDGTTVTNYPSGASGWWHLLDVRHSNPNNNYALQIAGSFYDQDLYFRKTNNTPTTAWNKFVYQNSSGNVGIGTASPGNKLTVSSSTGLDGIYATDGTRWTMIMPGTVGGGSYNPIVQANDNAIIYSNGTQGQGALVIAPWALGTSPQGIRMDGNGNVGIANTAPDSLLTIGSNQGSNGYIRFRGPTALEGNIYHDPTYAIHIDTSSNGYPIRIDGSALILGMTGNVGIGTTSPGQKLSVAGTIESTSGGFKFPDASVQTTAYLGGSQTISAGNVSAGNFGSNTGGGNYTFPSIVTLTSDGSPLTLGTTNSYQLHNYSGSDSLWIQSNGTATPAIVLGSAFDWDRQVKIAYTPGTTGASSGTLTIGQQDKNNANYTHGITTFLTNGLERMRIDAGGNVGIGTSTPTKLLDIQGGSSTHFTFDPTSSTSGYTAAFVMDNTGLKIGHNSASRDLELQTNSLTRFTIDQTGNVGIGTATPSYKLDVQGGAQRIVSTGSGADNLVLAEAAYPNIYRWKLQTTDRGGGIDLDINGTDSTDTATRIASFAIPAANRAALYVNGNVGIGTTSPGASLHVENPVTYQNDVTNLLLRKTSATTAGNAGAGITFQIQNELGQFGAYNTAGIYDVYDANGNRHALALKATNGGSSVMNTIAYFRGDGNVGIGTTGPGATLDVNGPIRASGNSVQDSAGIARITFDATNYNVIITIGN